LMGYYIHESLMPTERGSLPSIHVEEAVPFV